MEKGLILAKRAFQKGLDEMRFVTEYDYGFCVSRFHDAAEFLLYAIARKENANLRHEFMEMYDEIKNKSGIEPDGKEDMRRLNDLKNAFKHRVILIMPADAEEQRLRTEGFLRNNMRKFLASILICSAWPTLFRIRKRRNDSKKPNPSLRLGSTWRWSQPRRRRSF